MRKRKFTKEQLRDAIRARWPDIGRSTSWELASCVFNSPWLAHIATLDELCWKSDFGDAHDLYLLARYCIPAFLIDLSREDVDESHR